MARTGKDKDKNHSDEEEDPGKEFVEKTERDVKACLSRAGTITIPAQSRLVALMAEKQFQAFMDIDGSTGSASLLVNGYEPVEVEMSPFSFLGAKLYEMATSVRKNRPYVLAYFCDEHRAFSIKGSETCKPVGMMLSLLGQLAEQMVERGVPVDLSSLENKEWRMVRKHGIPTLGRVFEILARQPPPGSNVYCIIDEVTHYEQPVISTDLENILWGLAGIVEEFEEKGESEFKLLVMTRGQARGIGGAFAGRTIDLPENVEARDSSQAEIENLGKGEAKRGEKGKKGKASS
ncbi:hypothetical protein IMZ48_22325 [Candidatus Bathyarchaeota archaeon]|nr:hypothetical protein [Candidatus Bathyarchaeota archaeon]